MNNLGAVPKATGGARPKTKLISNGQIRSGKFEEQLSSKQKAKLINAFDGKITEECNSNGNQPKRKSVTNDLTNSHQISTFPDTGTSSKSLEEREVIITDEGVQIKRYALSPEWVEKRILIHYTRPPLLSMEGNFVVGAMDAWIEQMEFLVDDLSWLLNLPHYRFWSQILYDKSAEECIESYLTIGPRWYDKIPQDDNCLTVINDIHQLVFLICVRMATYKESKEDYITPSVFGNLIYDNFLYDICKIIDLCVLYGSTNGSLLEKMISNIFTHQPNYYNDLAILVCSLKSVLENLEKKLGVFDPLLLLLPRCANSETNLTLEDLQDIIHYMLDTFCSLQAFLHIFPMACETFHEKEFNLRLSAFYEKAIPKLIEDLSIWEEDPSDEHLLRRELLNEVATIRMSILFVFRKVLVRNCLPKNADETVCDSAAVSKSIEAFTHILTTSVEEKVFITDYNAAFELSEDLRYFEDKGADMTTLNFVKEAVDSIVSEMNLPADTSEILPPREKNATKDDTSGMNGYYGGETSSLSSVEIESLISAVQDLLPDLGGGFVKECLKYYNFSSEEVLNALLESNLPPCLDALDRSLKDSNEERGSSQKENSRQLEEAEKCDRSEGGVLGARVNIYDDDEFDVFRQPTKFNKNKAHKGKSRSKTVEYEKDPQLAEKMKRIIHQYESNQGYSIYEDEEKYTPIQLTAYDDEYDDTYDDNETGDVDNFGQDRRKVGSFFSLRGRGALNPVGLNFVEEEEEEREEGRKVLAEEEKKNDGKDKIDENGINPKFKRANASYRRGNINTEEKWDGGSSLVFTSSRRTTTKNDSYERGDTTPRNVDGETKTRLDFEPFCENPEETRRRLERKRMVQHTNNKGYYQQPNGTREESGSTPHQSRTSSKTNNHSGKTWRQGTQGEDTDNRRYHGGKYKEDTNHGKAQDKNYRHKMVHKNEQRRKAAQAKFRNCF